MRFETVSLLQNRTAEEFFNSIPANVDYDYGVVEVRSAGSYSDFTADYWKSDVLAGYPEVSSVLADLLIELRHVMADEHGTWFSTRLRVTHDGEFQFELNYDDEPDWYVPPSDDTLLADIVRYPRPASEIPEWHPAAIVGVEAPDNADAETEEYSVARAVFEAANKIAGWDKTVLEVAITGLRNAICEVRCVAGIDTVGTPALDSVGYRSGSASP